MSVKEAIRDLKAEMAAEGIEPERGLGSELFLFSSTLAPVVNVDLLVTNERGQILLAWRDDAHAGTGWHVPGGCIRFRETMEERIQKTAMAELGVRVRYAPEPAAVFEIFTPQYREHLEDQRERAHFITLVFLCALPEDYRLKAVPNGQAGQLRWFNELPDNLLDVQACYREKWDELCNAIKYAAVWM